MLTSDRIAEILAWNHELRHIEWKTQGDLTQRRYIAKISRAVMAMANTRGGGLVLIGVNESLDDNRLEGVPPDQLQYWKFDDLAAKFREYMQPPIAFEVHSIEYKGRHFVILEISEFEDQPLISIRDVAEDSGRLILQRGACYVRPRGKAESVPVATYEDMRDLLDIASETKARHILSQSHRIGLLDKSDKQRFHEELRGEW